MKEEKLEKMIRVAKDYCISTRRNCTSNKYDRFYLTYDYFNCNRYGDKKAMIEDGFYEALSKEVCELRVHMYKHFRVPIYACLRCFSVKVGGPKDHKDYRAYEKILKILDSFFFKKFRFYFSEILSFYITAESYPYMDEKDDDYCLFFSNGFIDGIFRQLKGEDVVLLTNLRKNQLLIAEREKSEKEIAEEIGKLHSEIEENEKKIAKLEQKLSEV
ncbi:MAG: hypothetical protein V1851_02355 [Patescibacteria group bacterium]